MLGLVRSFVERDAFKKGFPPLLRSILRYCHRKVRTAVEYHRVQALLARNRVLRDRHAGQERCFIIGNGPSIKQQDLTLLRGEATFVVNSFGLHPDYEKIAPTYHCVVDPLHVADVPNTQAWLLQMDRLPKSTAFFFPVEGRPLFERLGLFKDRDLFYLLLSEQHAGEGRVKADLTRPISGAICVTVGALMVASYLGFKKIYLMGCDHDWLAHPTVDTHFYDSNPHYPDLIATYPYERLMEDQLALWRAYRRIKEFALARGIQIYNATRGGFLDVFPRVTYEKLVEGKTRDASPVLP